MSLTVAMWDSLVQDLRGLIERRGSVDNQVMIWDVVSGRGKGVGLEICVVWLRMRGSWSYDGWVSTCVVS